MARKPHTIFVTFAAVVVMAVFVAITTWAAVPKSHGDSAAPTSAKGANYRPALWKVY
jgi:predicted MFS family arabinose efflux permease